MMNPVWLAFAGGYLLGGLFTVVVMCLLFIAKDQDQDGPQ